MSTDIQLFKAHHWVFDEIEREHGDRLREIWGHGELYASKQNLYFQLPQAQERGAYSCYRTPVKTKVSMSVLDVLERNAQRAKVEKDFNLIANLRGGKFRSSLATAAYLRTKRLIVPAEDECPFISAYRTLTAPFPNSYAPLPDLSCS